MLYRHLNALQENNNDINKNNIFSDINFIQRD